MALLDDINRLMRDHTGYTGDGQGGNGALPVGDRSTARYKPAMRDWRELLIALAQSMGDPSALQDILTTLDTKADLSNSGKAFPGRASAVAAGQGSLPASLGQITTREGNYLVLRSASATADDPLFPTAPQWGVVLRVPNDVVLGTKADLPNSGKMFGNRQNAVAAGQANLPEGLGQIVTREGDHLVYRNAWSNGDDPLFPTMPFWGVLLRVPDERLVDRKTAAIRLDIDRKARVSSIVEVAFLPGELPAPPDAVLDRFGRYDPDGKTAVAVFPWENVPEPEAQVDRFGRYDDGLIRAALLPSDPADVVGGVTDAAGKLMTGFDADTGEFLDFTSSVDPVAPQQVVWPEDIEGVVYTAQVGGFSTIHILTGEDVTRIPPGAPSFDAFDPDFRRGSYIAYRSDRTGVMAEWRTDIPQRSDVRRMTAIEHWIGYGQSNSMSFGIQGSWHGKITEGPVAEGIALAFNGSSYPNYTPGVTWGPPQQALPIPADNLIGFANLANGLGANPLTGQPEIVHDREATQVGAAEVYASGGTDVSVLVSGHGVGGYGHAKLKKGEQPYLNILAAVAAARDNAARLGLPYRVGHVDFIHGESDFNSTTYTVDTETLMSDLDDDISALLDESVVVPWFATQAMNWTAINLVTGRSPMAQLDLHERNPSRYMIYMPSYCHYWGPGVDQSPPNKVFDWIHRDAFGVRLSGEYLAKARKVFDATGTFDPLRPVAVTWDGTHVWVDFVGRVGSLQWNVYNAATNTNGVDDPGNYGFRFCDAAGADASVTIGAVTLSGNRVRITPSANPAGLYLGYADKGDPNGPPGPITGPRGCLSDSDPALPSAALQAFRADPARHWGGQSPANAAAPLVNWCVAFRKPIA